MSHTLEHVSTRNVTTSQNVLTKYRTVYAFSQKY